MSQSMIPPTYLAEKNPHPRDANISFDEGPHIYTINGDSNYKSVTTWNHSHFPHFDADKIISNMMNSPKWPENKYYGQTPEQIKALWKANGAEAATAGTKMHYDIECFYNECPRENDSVEYSYFKDFQEDHKDKVAYRTEWMIYDETLRLAGSIDMTYVNDDGTIDIYDWKRCRNIKKSNPFESATTKCIEHLPNCNFWHYALQLNTYKTILETHYGKKIRDMYLVCLHPENKNKSYIKYAVPTLESEIKDLFSERYLDLCKDM